MKNVYGIETKIHVTIGLVIGALLYTLPSLVFFIPKDMPTNSYIATFLHWITKIYYPLLLITRLICGSSTGEGVPSGCFSGVSLARVLTGSVVLTILIGGGIGALFGLVYRSFRVTGVQAGMDMNVDRELKRALKKRKL